MANPNENQIINRGKVVLTDITGEMKTSYIDYAMSVIVDRALPDVRDGLKPVQRRILYSMNELGLGAAAKFRKSALVVGDVLGKYHPHGDAACYGALTRLAQDFSLLHPLVIGQGNFGSIDGDPPAAMRYTEVKMAPLATELLRDIEKETVEFAPNYDGTRVEPLVLPSAIPNLLINGAVGIAVGMATKILPHNLSEVMQALIHLVDNPEATTEDLLRFVKGPDFPTGGLIFDEKEIAHASATGRGGVLVRGETEIVDPPAGGKSGSVQIIITSIPYQINKADLIVKIADLVREKKIEGIRDIREESTTLDNMRVVIELKNGADPQKIVNALYKNTELETVFHYNQLALVGGVPRLLSLRDIAEEFIKHRQTILLRRTKFDLNRALEREHILLGLKKAIDIIDEVIATIKKSADAEAAKINLVAKFKFSEPQALAILELKLQRLAGLEIKKILAELKEKQELIKYLQALLADNAKIRAVIKGEFEDIAKKYQQPRRTKVIKHGAQEINAEDLVPEKENVLVLTAGGYVKRTDPAEYRTQRRGGVGVADLNVKEEDFVTILLSANTHSDLLFFTDRGKCYQLKMYEIPEGKRSTRGKSLMNFLPLGDDEKVTSILPVPKTAKPARTQPDTILAGTVQSGGGKRSALLMITRDGVAKKVASSSFNDVRRSGIIAIKLRPPGAGRSGDALLAVLLVETGDEAIIASAAGQAIRFKEKDIREMGRAAGGVRGIKLKKGDAVIGASVVVSGNQASEFLVVTERGYGKKTKLKEYKTQRRGGSGIKTAKITGKTGKLVGAKVIYPEEVEIVAMSKQSQAIRTVLGEIPSLGRQTQGVRIMKLREGDSLASLTFL